jgi:hypothetical protein
MQQDQGGGGNPAVFVDKASLAGATKNSGISQHPEAFENNR